MQTSVFNSYPAGVPQKVRPEQYRSLAQMFDESFQRHADCPFSICMVPRRSPASSACRCRPSRSPSRATKAAACRGAKPSNCASRTPNVMTGHYNQPAETAATFAADGFMRTGGIVVIREDGYIRKLTGCKRPKHIEFRDALPKTKVGTIVRRELRTVAH